MEPCPVNWETDTLLGYWNSRRVRACIDSYRDVQLAKFPEDLATYEHVLWLTKPEVIVEIGVWAGGSALWFCDRMRALYRAMGWVVNNPLYIGLDIKLDIPRRTCSNESAIILIEGDAAEKVDEVEKWVAGRRCMIVEDSAHTYDNTAKMLQSYHKFVSPGCYYVVEDTLVDDGLLRWESDPRGAGHAVLDFVREHPEFEHVICNWYGLTCNALGWLRRRDGV